MTENIDFYSARVAFGAVDINAAITKMVDGNRP